jgi:hypothetical protein
MASSSLDSFALLAANTAMVAAADFMAHEGLCPTDRVLKRITVEMRATVKAAISEALEDGKAAFDAGMTQIASRTMTLTFANAGIAAVKNVMDC